MSDRQAERVHYADVLRCVAIVAVLAVHILGEWYMKYYYASKPLFGILHLCGALCGIAVPTFLMLTGAFMLSKDYTGSYWEFFRKRVLSLLIPFLIFSLIYYVNNGLTTNNLMSALGFMTSFTTGEIKYHFWFMYTILLFYMLIPFLSKLVQNLKRCELRILILLLAGGSLISSVAVIFGFFGKSVLSSFILPDFVLLMNYLFIGYYLYRFPIRQRTRIRIYVLAGLAIVATVLVDIFCSTAATKDFLLYSGRITALMISVAFFLLCKHNSKARQPNKITQRVLKFVVPLIFYIYMIHVLIMEYVKPPLLSVLHPENFASVCCFMLVELVVVCAVSTVGAFLFYKIYNFACVRVQKIVGKFKDRITREIRD